MRTARLFVSLLCLIALTARAAEFTVFVTEPSGARREAWPVTSGVPFAQGALRDPRDVALRTENGERVPLQTDVLARWPDGSVRWLLLDFQTDLEANAKRTFTVATNTRATDHTVQSPLRVTETSAATTIDTGPLRIELRRDSGDPFGSIWLDRNRDGAFSPDERVTREGLGFSVDHPEKTLFHSVSAPTEIVVEEAGPERVCVRLEGTHAAKADTMFRYVIRLHAFRGQPFVRCSYTFINDRQDAVMTSIRSLGLGMRLANEAGAINTRLLDGRANESGSLFQIDENSYELNRRPAGRRAQGWASVAGANAGVAIGVREFWQQWPKGIEVNDRTIRIDLCPPLPAGLYDGKPLEEENKLTYALRGGVHTFKVGVAKTHELWLNVFGGDAAADSLAGFFAAAEQPLLATCEPGYVRATKAVGDLPPADPNKFFGYDAWFERALEAHLQRRDREREYGLLNFGDWFGERKVNWGNLEYDLQHGLMMQYLRTGDRRYFDRAAQAARHHIDVDVVHATNPHVKNPWGAPPRVGEIWLHSLSHTGGYYENAPLPVSRTYQMGHSSNYGHVWISGDLDYYHLTGDRRARDVALQVADMMASTMTQKVGTHIRNLGWPMILVLSAYEATGDGKYLAAAKRNWEALHAALDPQQGWVVTLAPDHCFHPEGSTSQERATKYAAQRCRGNVPFMVGLTLSGLARYHRLTGDPEVLRAITVGIDQMIRETWLEDVKTFRYTACPLSSKTGYSLFLLSAEAMAYEAKLTGNAEHRRILREAFRSAVEHSSTSGFGKGFAQNAFFAPHALGVLE